MTTSDNDTTFRRCSNGDNCIHPSGCMQPDDSEHFYERKSAGKQCKACHRHKLRERARERYETDRDEILERQRQWRQENIDHARELGRRSYQRNRETILARQQQPEIRKRRIAYKRQWHIEHRQSENQRAREYSRTNREKLRDGKKRWSVANKGRINQRRRERWQQNPEQYREKAKNYRDQNPDRVRGWQRATYRRNRLAFLHRNREYKRRNPEYMRGYLRVYKINNRERIRAYNQNREARKRSLPNTLTTEQWQRALDYFNGCCAVCGRQLNDLFGAHTAAMDHWIALNDPSCPGTTALNCVPLCHGENGCNNRKGSKGASVWLNEAFKKKASLIIERIEAYFSYVRNQDTYD